MKAPFAISFGSGQLDHTGTAPINAKKLSAPVLSIVYVCFIKRKKRLHSELDKSRFTAWGARLHARCRHFQSAQAKTVVASTKVVDQFQSGGFQENFPSVGIMIIASDGQIGPARRA
jgi:hypothetical protein